MESDVCAAQVASLQMKVMNEAKLVDSRTQELLAEWAREKPVAGSLRPEVALRSLAILESKLNKLVDDRGSIQRAKEALEMSDTGVLHLV